MAESKLRKRLLDHSYFPDTTAIRIEPVAGTPPGQPDFAISFGCFYVPTELKDEQYPIRALRPAQRKWFKQSAIRKSATLLLNYSEQKASAKPTRDIAPSVRALRLNAKLLPVYDKTILFEDFDISAFHEFCKGAGFFYVSETGNPIP